MRLDEYMAERGLSDEAFAGLVGVSRVSVTRWRNKTRFPSRDSLQGIARATGGHVTADDFFELSTTTRSGAD